MERFLDGGNIEPAHSYRTVHIPAFYPQARRNTVDYIKEYGNLPLGKFIRSLLGLDKTAANQLFSDFIQSGNLSADQITFINNIISFLTINGIIDKTMLFEPPFTDIHDQGITGIFDDVQVVKIVRILDGVNGNAVNMA